MVDHYFTSVINGNRCGHRHKKVSTARACGDEIHFVVTDNNRELANVIFEDEESWKALHENIDEDDAETCILILRMTQRQVRNQTE